ncbi:MAG: trypsin [Desulfobulbus propionicus]|nr:MAG: trypsin [Desulfobulbus propionicus]
MSTSRLVSVLYILFFCAPWLHAAEGGTHTTLSPYFFVQKGETSLDHFPLKGTKVEAIISGVIANVTVQQTYVNKGPGPINARYIFPGSTRSAVHGMTMTIGERRVLARIQEKQQAKQTFAKAKAAGKSSSLLSQQRPNVFSMDVANILPGDTVVIELQYSELLVPSDAVYSFVYPAVVGPRYSDQPQASLPPQERWIANPYLHEGTPSPADFSLSVQLAAGMPIRALQCRTHATQITYLDKENAEIQLDPQADSGQDRDFILTYRLQGQQITSGLLLQKRKDAQYFLLMAQPPERVLPEDIPPREYLFIVDVSGSMQGFPLETAKALLKDLVSELRPTDSFNLLLFAGSSELLAPNSLQADQRNLRKAIQLLQQQQGGGGTNLLPALQRALGLPRKEGVSRSVVVITDGYIDAERAVFHSIQKNLGTSNLFAFGIGAGVNRHLIEEMAQSGQGEAFVVTDPTLAGKTAARFRDYIAAPVLTDIAITMHGFGAWDVEPQQFPDLFAQRPILVFGKWRGIPEGVIELSGTSGKGPFTKRYQVSEATLLQDRGLELLWARTRIRRLSDFGRQQVDPEHKAAITALGLSHNLLTAYTSFVAVDEPVRNPKKQADDVTQPLPLPKGVSNCSIGAGTMHKVAEPEAALLLPILAVFLGVGLYQRRRACR